MVYIDKKITADMMDLLKELIGSEFTSFKAESFHTVFGQVEINAGQSTVYVNAAIVVIPRHHQRSEPAGRRSHRLQQDAPSFKILYTLVCKLAALIANLLSCIPVINGIIVKQNVICGNIT